MTEPRAEILHGDNLELLPRFADGEFQLVYLDPPFNTGRDRRARPVRVTADPTGDRVGFGGRRYATRAADGAGYGDRFGDYASFLAPRLRELRRVLDPTGTLYLHLDWRESHRAKLLLDDLFGPECFLNEIIWAYDFGGRSNRRWPAKHDTILVYVRDALRYHFDAAAVDREPYMAPGLVTPEKAARGKLPTDVWWHTIVGTSSRERTGYPTQKPEGVLRRIVAASSRPGDTVLDPFAGSGTTGAAAAALGRGYVLIDNSAEAVAVMHRRLPRAAPAPARPRRSPPPPPAPG